MTRPAVLLLDPRAERLRDLGRRLAGEGYEVVPVADAARARRFAAGLGTAVIVVSTEALATVADPEALLAAFSAPEAGARRTLVLLGERSEEEERLPESASFLAIGGLPPEEVARRLLLVLLGRELGAEPDARLTSLVGDLAQTPLLDLLRGLHPSAVSGRLELRGGTMALDRGRVTAAVCGAARGLKAFCRLGKLHEGPFRIVPGRPPATREIAEDLDALVLAAIEDSLGEIPDPRIRLEIELGPSFFAAQFNSLQQRILGVVQRGATLREVLDGLPERDGEIVHEVLVLEGRGVLARRAPAVPPVQIVTDSTADLPPDLARAHGIVVVPLSVAFGREVYRDRVDVQPGQFYGLLEKKKDHPVSSPPAREDFDHVYREQIGRGRDVVSLHISAKLSKTAEHARAGAAEALAAREQDGGDGRTPSVAILDSSQVSLGLGLLALFAARMAARNEPAESIRRRLLAMAPRIHTLFVLDTLEFLARGGRIGKAKAMMGGLLGIKPILGMADGEIVPVGQVRGGRGAHARILEILEKRLERGRPVVAGISHGNAPAWADRLEGLVRGRFQVAELIEAEVGPVVGTHAGPGVVSISAFQPSDDEAPLLAPL